nr:Retrovirus-related Pol polyprotein from transposon TNT 1-94 [Ipomoea batatas]
MVLYLGLGSQQSELVLMGYVNSDYAGDMDNKHPTIGYVFTLDGPICWRSSIQSIVALSTTEAEYMIVTEAAKKVRYLINSAIQGTEWGSSSSLSNKDHLHLLWNGLETSNFCANSTAGYELGQATKTIA